MSAAPKVVLTRRFAVPPARVWDACTRPEQLARWFSPTPFHVCEVEADVRVGGRFRFRMTGAPGTYAAEGEYERVVPNECLVFGWTWVEGPADDAPDGVTSRVTFDFRPDGAGTQMTLTHERLPDRAQADSHAEGWTEALAKLDAVLAADAA